MRRMGVILGHPIFTCFRGSTGCRRDPPVSGCHSLVSEPRYAISRKRESQIAILTCVDGKSRAQTQRSSTG